VGVRRKAVDGQITAFMDIGTNAVRMLLVRFNDNLTYTVLSKQREAVRLGEGEFLNQELQPEPMHRTVLVCSKFAEMARSYGVQKIVAVATSASREAANRDRLLRSLKKEAKIDVRIISGKEEARLIYLGVSSGLNLGDKRAMFIDIGGGSTEIIVGDARKYHFLDSLKLGAIRLSSIFLADDESETVGPAKYALVQRYIRNAAAPVMHQLRQYETQLTIGSSGTIVNLFEVAMNMAQRPVAAANSNILTYAQLKAATNLLCSLPLERRRRVQGINPDRADIIIGGAVILDTVMCDLGISEIHISDRGLREGLLVDYLSRKASTRAGQLSFRERTVLQLGKSCGFDRTHAMNVTRIALELFDRARRLKLHDLGTWERELLEYAAMLHDIGMFLSLDGHQAHSAYFIRNADLLGFDRKELAIMAAIAEFHRGQLPRKTNGSIALMDRESREAVRILCIFLRVAESLDRSRTGVVRHVKLYRNRKMDFELEVIAENDCQLELWGVMNHVKAFKKVFGREFVVSLSVEKSPPGKVTS
jgi:exopolyphosphatase / guanosine-5'-triphosphate,3'-diphosphate pyrophosphatase